MKNSPGVSFRRLVLGSAAILLAPLFTYASDPIPGVDVKLGRNPGGIIAKVTTDKDGRFVFDSLVAGSYVLSVDAPQTRQLISTTRSNIKHQSTVQNGVQVIATAIALGTGPTSDNIELTAAHGKITGVVTRADAPKPTGAQPARDAKPAR
jgi:hypothetical protein